MLTRLLFGVIFAMLATTNNASAATLGCEARALQEREVLRGTRVESWEPLNDRAVLIWLKRSARAYFVRLADPLEGLTRAAIIDLVDGDHDGIISPCGFDGITVGARPIGRRIVRIISIKELSARRTAALEAHARTARQARMRVGNVAPCTFRRGEAARTRRGAARGGETKDPVRGMRHFRGVNALLA